MEQLVDSVRRSGVMTPATVRQKEDGRYELISGHRRKKACELAGLETLKCEVKELTRDEAIIVMVESNLQRTTILPSEKAFAYKMRLEAMNRQGQRSDLTSCPVGNKFTSASKVAKEVGNQLLLLEAMGDEPITLFISSQGGHVDSGYYIHDMINFVKPEVNIIGSGWVVSAGVIIYLASKKENRYSLPNTRFMIRQPSGGVQ